MVDCWEWATFLVETLAMKLARLDEDGLDLVFTSGDNCNLKNVKDASKFRKAMDKACPDRSSYPTDMALTIGKLSRSYLHSSTAKEQTLIIVTDGMWGVNGSAVRENTVDKKIIGIITELIKKFGSSSVDERRFSIQFVSFATDPVAHAYLKYLDSTLWRTHTIPSANGKFHQLPQVICHLPLAFWQVRR